VLVRRVPLSLAKNKPTVARFLDEARLTAFLADPAIVQVLESGEDGGTYYCVFEHVFGETLEAALEAASAQGSQVPVGVALRWAVGLLQALAAAHAARNADGEWLRVIHRDVRPGNVWAGFDGQVKLTGFGAAAHGERTEQTPFGVVAGKLAYLAPELLSQSPADARSDLFSVGAVLYELLTQKRPFERATDFLTMKALREETPQPPSFHREGLSSALDGLLLKALARAPGERFSDAKHMQQALEKAGAAPAAEAAAYLQGLFPRRVADPRTRTGVDVPLEVILTTVSGTSLEDEAPEKPLPPERPALAATAARPRTGATARPPAKPATFSEAPLGGNTDRSEVPRPHLELAAEDPSVPDGTPTAPPVAPRFAREPEPSAPEPTRSPEPVRAPEPVKAQRPAPRPVQAVPLPTARPTEAGEPRSDPRVKAQAEIKQKAEADAQKAKPLPEPKPEPKPELKPQLHVPVPALKPREAKPKKPRFQVRVDRGLPWAIYGLVWAISVTAGVATVQAQRGQPLSLGFKVGPQQAAVKDQDLAPDSDNQVADDPALGPAPVAPPSANPPEQKLTEAAAPKAPVAPGRPGSLQLTAVPYASISVDGKTVGDTPLTVPVGAGAHVVKFIGPSGLVQSFKIVVPSGKQVKKQVSFQSKASQGWP
jgi:serine/threonine protein kinase